ncbi:MAG: flagellar basal body rod protein FlgC [Lachnospiraceae bacterium]|jgi:flagellar basal-body rod protein FlgC|nr:flagellar basal body rod protein FlgC [Lachnospiraceae bacterium]GFI19309.1 flagellar basal-body rod protein FlgC [Lachnospiraceae bacterium]
MSIFNAFNINASGMTAQRYRMDTISENVANANTTRTEDGTPYRRKVVTFEERGAKAGTFSSFLGSASDRFKGQGVRVGKVTEDNWTQMNLVYDPSHPDADENGYVTYPNVNIITEMTNLIDASRAYEANATAFSASKSIAMKGLEMGQS